MLRGPVCVMGDGDPAGDMAAGLMATAVLKGGGLGAVLGRIAI